MIKHLRNIGLAALLGLSAASASAVEPSYRAGAGSANTVVIACPPLTGNIATTCNFGSGGGGGGGGASTIADGADVAEGATTDAAATAGGTGTVSAKMRALTSLLSTLNGLTATAAAQAAQQTSLTAIANSDAATAAVTGTKTDAVATDTTSSWSLNSLLRGILAKLSSALTVTGTVTDTQATAANLNAQVVGNVGAGTADSGNSVKAGCVYNSTTPTYTAGQRTDCQTDTRGNLSVNIMSGSSSAIVATASDGQSVGTYLPVRAVPQLFNGTTTDRQRVIGASDGTGLGIVGVAIAPQSAAAGALTPVVAGSAVSSLVVKAAAGNLYDAYANCTSACWLMVFNSTTVPVNGVTTSGAASGNLVDCLQISANNQNGVNYQQLPERFSVGIAAAISSTACGTLTLSTVGFIHARAQ